MSVINQMLRDLDARKATPPGHEGVLDGVRPVELPPLRHDTVPPPVLARETARRPWRWRLAAPAIALALGGAWWFVAHGPAGLAGGLAPWRASLPPPPQPAAPVVTQAPQAAPAVAEPLPATPPATPTLMTGATAAAAKVVPPAAMVLRPAAAQPPGTAPVQPTGTAPPPAAPPATPVRQPGGGPQARTAAAPTPEPPARELPAAAELLKQPANTPAADAASTAEARLQQALLLERQGQRARAIAWLRDGLPQASEPGALAAHQALARMELAEQRPRAALELLRPLAGRLSAEGWMLKANAAQRLGEHAEAVAAYDAALLQRPGEGLWLAGKAISLAALGRRDEARAAAGQARGSTRLDPQLAAYLEQLGL